MRQRNKQPETRGGRSNFDEEKKPAKSTAERKFALDDSVTVSADNKESDLQKAVQSNSEVTVSELADGLGSVSLGDDSDKYVVDCIAKSVACSKLSLKDMVKTVESTLDEELVPELLTRILRSVHHKQVCSRDQKKQRTQKKLKQLTEIKKGTNQNKQNRTRTG